MNSIDRQVADTVWSFLSQTVQDQADRDQTYWVVCETREQGIDITYRLIKHLTGSTPARDIAYDTLPTQPVFNEATGRTAFIFSQPNHIPTVQTTMQGTLADRRNQVTKDLSPIERDYADVKGQKYNFGGSTFEDKMILDAQEKVIRPDKPDVLMINQEYPMWTELRAFATEPSVEVLYTDRVKNPTVPPADEVRGRSGQYKPAE